MILNCTLTKVQKVTHFWALWCDKKQNINSYKGKKKKKTKLSVNLLHSHCREIAKPQRYSPCLGWHLVVKPGTTHWSRSRLHVSHTESSSFPGRETAGCWFALNKNLVRTASKCILRAGTCRARRDTWSLIELVTIRHKLTTVQKQLSLTPGGSLSLNITSQ